MRSDFENKLVAPRYIRAEVSLLHEAKSLQSPRSFQSLLLPHSLVQIPKATQPEQMLTLQSKVAQDDSEIPILLPIPG